MIVKYQEAGGGNTSWNVGILSGVSCVIQATSSIFIVTLVASSCSKQARKLNWTSIWRAPRRLHLWIVLADQSKLRFQPIIFAGSGRRLRHTEWTRTWMPPTNIGLKRSPSISCAAADLLVFGTFPSEVEEGNWFCWFCLASGRFCLKHGWSVFASS